MEAFQHTIRPEWSNFPHTISPSSSSTSSNSSMESLVAPLKREQLPLPPPQSLPSLVSMAMSNNPSTHKYQPPSQLTLRRDVDIFITGKYKQNRKPAPTATHELRQLREDAANMEREMQTLKRKWATHLPDERLLLSACEAAKAKWISLQAEQLNLQLKQQLLEQQLYLASLQHLLTESPLLQPSKSKEIFDAIHTFVRIDPELTMAERQDQLEGHCEIGLRITPSLMRRFAQRHVSSATTTAPFSHTSVMADGNYTYFANVLVCKILHPSLLATTQAAMTYFGQMAAELKKHVGISSDVQDIHPLRDGCAYRRLRYSNGSDFIATLNTTFAVQMASSHAAVVADFIDEDDHYPSRTADGLRLIRDSCVSLYMNTIQDPVTGQNQVLLQRITAIRYNLPPHSALLHREITSTLPWFNGDILMEVICKQLDQRQHQQLM